MPSVLSVVNDWLNGAESCLQSSWSRIWNAATETLLLDQTDILPLWTPADGIFDRLMLIDGEVGGDATIANLATVDNVAFSAVPLQTPGPQGDLNGGLKVDAADLAILLGN